MTLDLFNLRDRVVGAYESYVRGFIHIHDPRIRSFVDEELNRGELWPDAVLQKFTEASKSILAKEASKGELGAKGAATLTALMKDLGYV